MIFTFILPRALACSINRYCLPVVTRVYICVYIYTIHICIVIVIECIDAYIADITLLTFIMVTAFDRV